MKKIFLFLFLFINIIANSQRIYIINDDESNIKISMELENIRNHIKYDSNINWIVEKRISYFSNIFKETAIEGYNLWDMLDSIPKNDKAHKELFGKPDYFISSIPYFSHKNTGVTKNEIMQEYLLIEERNNRVNIINFVNNINTLIYNEIKIDIGEYFMNSYMGSYSHKKTIEKKSNKYYSSKTRIIILEKYNEHVNKWIYEIMVFNLILFR